MDVKASRFDVDTIMNEVINIKRDPVSDQYIKHCVDKGVVDQRLRLRDYIGNIGVRININRDQYKIPTGLYAFGKPDENSEVLVTGNYKLTFDYLRKYLKKSYHVLVIDTDGINVWCAAGKGRFGTAEVIRMLQAIELPVSHNRITLPQLSAPGTQSVLITKHTGKKVVFGPVRIQDMDEFFENGLSDEMRIVHFKLIDRMRVAPLELFVNLKYLIILWLISLLPFMPNAIFTLTLSSIILGTLVFPAVMPLLPFKMFYKNGLLLSMILFFTVPLTILNIGFILFGMLYTSYLAMTFTGSTTFTSLTGVKMELDEAIPRMFRWAGIAIIVTLVGIILEVI